MDVFKAFPEAIVSWTWLAVKRGTEVGNVATEAGAVNVIETEADKATLYNTPKANGITADLLVYVRPEDLPEMTPAKLMANYGLQNDIMERYDIINVGVGKNQDNGNIEHYELALQLASMES